jgi:hypothetical protein
VETEASQLEALQQAKADTNTQPEQAPVKAEMMAEKASAVSEPKQTPAKTAAVTSTRKTQRLVTEANISIKTPAEVSADPDKYASGEAVDKSPTHASASHSSILQVNYLVDGDRNFIRAWPYE